MKVVIYGAAPEDLKLVAHFAHKVQLVLEDQPLGVNNFHPDANIVVVFPSSIIKKDYITPKLLAVISRAVGVDHIKCMKELEELGVPVLRPKGYATQSVAEYSLNAISRELSKSYFDSQGERDRTEISSRRVAIVGGGAIGSRLKAILDVIGCETVLVTSMTTEGAHPYAKLVELAADADFICLHAGLRDANTGLLNEKILASVKMGAVLVNAARGEMVDNQALLKALDHGIISKAYLDVVANDNFSERVISHPNVIFTNHTAWKTEAALRKSQQFFVSALEKLIEN
jgi:phosphoglycerate dehydrogenase-like enzyme